MKRAYSKFLLISLCLVSFCLISLSLLGQTPGDTIEVRAFNYESATRDSSIVFPDDPSVEFEKILLYYNMRCKDGLVSPPIAGQTNIGCGEWDYSCNTYITDSTRVDSTLAFHPSHTITNYFGTTYYAYVIDPLFDFFRFVQPDASGTTVSSETSSVLGGTSLPIPNAIATAENSGKAQYLYTAAELSSAGLSVGDIGAIAVDADAAGFAGFLRLRLKQTSAVALAEISADTSAFTEAYYLNTSLAPGANRLQFHTPFNWDGSSNVIVEFSFTNSAPSSAINLSGENSPGTYGLEATENYYLNTAAGGIVDLTDASTSAISDQITISYWAKGGTGVSTTNSTTIEARDAAFDRQVNIHHPWSNSRIYWDCGNDGGGYDRIDKLATTAELEDNWNHWAFTKNTGTGDMKIYKNGVLWHSGTGKVKAIDIDSMIFGASALQTYTYNGDLDELRIWDIELTEVEILDWMNRKVNSSHPNYANLVAYFPMNAGSGSSLSDIASGGSAPFINPPVWKYQRGIEVARFFTETVSRPQITFLQGTYTFVVANDTVFDSLQVVGNNVTKYMVSSAAGSLEDDAIVPISSNVFWHANNEKIYEGLTGVEIGTYPVTADDNLTITDLEYVRRDPSKLEIMSFVTPYGINLDLGMEGKTWLFDVTDFAPVLKGSKRINMQAGGQWQEDMDIRFLFIVGTPPREVLDIKQIWKADAARNYQDILSDRYFPPRDVQLDPNGVYFKVRTAITGHGAEGEFISRNHSINIDGGPDDFTWPAWKECALNPVYPQGGTWIYDRAGWCPGMATDIRENDITALVSPGSTVEIDYGLNTGSGDSRYYVNNQLVTYGPANHTLDAALVEIQNPSSRVEFARDNPICTSPVVVIQNTGSTELTALDIVYWIDGSSSSKTYNWTGDLAFMEKATVALPTDLTFWGAVEGEAGIFHAAISAPNGGADEYDLNNAQSSSFSIPAVLPSGIILRLTTNNAGFETSYTLTDESGVEIVGRSGLGNLETHLDTLLLSPGCYTLTINDSGDDGYDFWANSDGTGTFRIRDLSTNAYLYLFDGDFGRSFKFNFTVDFKLAVEDIEPFDLSVFPNPASDYFIVQGETFDREFALFDLHGRQVQCPVRRFGDSLQFMTDALASGVYLLRVVRGSDVRTVKVVIE